MRHKNREVYCLTQTVCQVCITIGFSCGNGIFILVNKSMSNINNTFSRQEQRKNVFYFLINGFREKNFFFFKLVFEVSKVKFKIFSCGTYHSGSNSVVVKLLRGFHRSRSQARGNRGFLLDKVSSWFGRTSAVIPLLYRRENIGHKHEQLPRPHPILYQLL